LRLAKANASTSTVLIDEFDAGGFERLADNFESGPSGLMAPCLKLANRNDANAGMLGQFTLAPLDKTTRCSALCRSDHNNFSN
jgi:hypothetical protein